MNAGRYDLSKESYSRKKVFKKNSKLFYGPKSNLASNLMKKIKVNYLLFPTKKIEYFILKLMKSIVIIFVKIIDQ